MNYLYVFASYNFANHTGNSIVIIHSSVIDNTFVSWHLKIEYLATDITLIERNTMKMLRCKENYLSGHNMAFRNK